MFSHAAFWLVAALAADFWGESGPQNAKNEVVMRALMSIADTKVAPFYKGQFSKLTSSACVKKCKRLVLEYNVSGLINNICVSNIL